jgi:amino acid transporter
VIVTLSEAPEATDETSLRGGRLGVVGIVFYVIAAASPLVGMTGALPVAIVLGNGAAVPGAYVAVGLVLLFFSIGYATMSEKVTNAGAFFAYVGRGLGIGPGVGAAYASLLAYLAIQLAIYGFFGAVMSGKMNAEFGVDFSWWVWSLIGWAIVLVLSAFSVDVGAKVLGVLLALELGSLLLMSLAVFVQGGGPDGVELGASFAPDNILVGGLAGSAGIALAFAFASFIGFEATAIYGEESRDPKRAVPIATYAAVALITVIFALTTLAVVSALGADTVIDEAAGRSAVDGVPLVDSAQVLFSVAEEYVGSWLASTMGWLVLSSLFAGLLAFQNSAARYFFSMGRAGVLPRQLDHVNAAGAPVRGSVVVSVVTGVVILLFAVGDKDPVLNLFFWFSGLAVVAIVLVEVLVCAAVIAFFRRNPEGASVWKTVVAPILATAGLVLGEYLLMSRFGLLSGTVAEGVDPTTQSWGLSTLGYTLILLPFAVFAVGAVVGFVRRRGENAAAISDLVG